MEKEEGIHVGLICDGNRRWTKGWRRKVQELSPVDGHKAGFRAIVDQIIPALSDNPYVTVDELTLYAFSTENWSRPPKEVNKLMQFMREEISKWVPELIERGIELNHAGSAEKLEEDYPELYAAIKQAEKDTSPTANQVTKVRLKLNICLNYGGDSEIRKAALESVKQMQEEGLDLETFAEVPADRFEKSLDVPRNVDLLIRTSGEQRTSNFLPYQTRYAEMIFEKRLLPTIKKRHVYKWLKTFTKRNRTKGGNLSHNM